MDTHTEVSQLALTNVEQALVDQVKAGEVLDLAGAALADQQVDEKTMQPWGPERTIRAAVIRDILRGRLAPDPDPHGLRLRGARIEGTLDLDHLTSTVPINLTSCLLGQGMVARDATLPTVTLQECWLEHPSQPLIADRLTTTLLSLTRSTITAHSEDGGVSLEGAHLGQLKADGATLANDTGPALYADGLNVDHDVVLTGEFKATGDGELGAVRIVGGHIGGQLDCTDATLTNKTGPALVADGLNIDQGAFLSGEFKATGDSPTGAVHLCGGHIGGRLDCTDATLTNKTGPALRADGLTVDQDAFLRGKFKATGDGPNGAVRLQGGHIGGQLSCTDATLTNKTGPALRAESLTVDQDAFLKGKFKATGDGADGAVRLLGGHIGGELDCTDATLTNKTGPALRAESLTVDQDAFLKGKFKATGDGADGAVRLLGGHIGGELHCTDATLTNKTGPALYADGLNVDQSAFLGGKFKATGDGPKGAVRLSGGHIGGQLNCTDATLTNKTGPALVAESLKVDYDVFLSGFTAEGGGNDFVLDLARMGIGGVLLAFGPEALKHATDPSARVLDVDGLTYAGLPAEPPAGVGSKGWLQLIRKQTQYAAQPYQYLATALSAAGNDGEARDVLIAQRQDQINQHALTGWRHRTWARFTGVMLGYGYRPSRTLLYLLSVIIISVVLSGVLGAHGGLAQPNPPAGKPAAHCTTLERTAVGLDLGTPLISTNIRDRCDTTNSATGDGLTIAGWTLTVLAWALATLFIAGFTSAVRKT